jgi:tetratricopeptide (TPR) repeat protein
VNKFVQEYKNTIDQELLNSQSISKARRIYESGNLEMAWRAVVNIPPDSYARNLEADFIETLHDEFHSYLHTQMERAHDRKDWDAAYENAQKIIRYFPLEKSHIMRLATTFEKNKEQAARLHEAKRLMDKGNYQAATQTLEMIPDDSIYAQDARVLRQQSERAMRISEATDAYNQGDVKGALKLLRGYADDESAELAQEIQTIMEIHKKATESMEKGYLLEAKKLWEEIRRVTSMHPENHYYAEATRHLDRLPEMRKRHAEELVEKAQNEFRNGNYLQARSYYEEAVKLDPDSDIGTKGLEMLREEGRIAYNRACNTKDPQQAIELFEKAIQLLSPEDKYYSWAQQRKEEVEEQLKENS